MKLAQEKKGQFVIIAVLMAAIMIVSVGTLMHTALTYYKHEPWEEYSTLIGDIEVNSRKLLELSLADYTNSDEPNPNILSNNLEKWQKDLTEIYPNTGIVLRCTYNSTGSQSWNPTAEAKFTLNVERIGLAGYTFSNEVVLSLAIEKAREINLTSNEYEIDALVTSESGSTVSGLKNSFKLNNVAATGVRPFPDSSGRLIYTIPYKGTFPVLVEVWDQRGIRAFVNYSYLP